MIILTKKNEARQKNNIANQYYFMNQEIKNTLSLFLIFASGCSSP